MSLDNTKVNRVTFTKGDLLEAIRQFLITNNEDGDYSSITNLNFSLGLDGGFDSLDPSETVLTLELPLDSGS